MRIKSFAAVGVGVFALATGCQQGPEAHRGHRHPPSEHVRDHDQDLLPGRVKSAFTREFHDATITDTEKQTHPDGAVHWEIRYRTKDGQNRIAEFDTDGKLVSKK